MLIETKDWVSVTEYAKRNNISTVWVYKLIKRGDLKTMEFADKTLIFIGDKKQSVNL